MTDNTQETSGIISRNIYDGTVVDIITVEYAKAFDSISLYKLSYKFQFHSIIYKMRDN